MLCDVDSSCFYFSSLTRFSTNKNTFISLNRSETCGERRPPCHGAARAARRACAVRRCASLIGNQFPHIDNNKPDRVNLLVHWLLFWAIHLPCTCRLTTCCLSCTVTNIMLHRCAMHRVLTYVAAAHCASSPILGHPLLYRFSALKLQRAYHHDVPRCATPMQSRRLFSSEPPTSPPTLVISANCAKRIAHLQKQKAPEGTGTSFFLNY